MAALDFMILGILLILQLDMVKYTLILSIIINGTPKLYDRFSDISGYAPRLEKLGNRAFENPFSANFIKWSNILKQFVGNLPT